MEGGQETVNGNPNLRMENGSETSAAPFNRKNGCRYGVTLTSTRRASA